MREMFDVMGKEAFRAYIPKSSTCFHPSSTEEVQEPLEEPDASTVALCDDEENSDADQLTYY